MSTFLNKDVSELQRHLSAISKHTFDFDKATEFGAFINLAQHHGYPTPLIDWTFSPYVAAFFAFKGIKKETTKSELRVFISSTTRNGAGRSRSPISSALAIHSFRFFRYWELKTLE